MEFKECLVQQLQMHPSMQPQDIVKMCFQAAFGAEHLLGDINVAREYFEKEYAGTEPDKEAPLYEHISEDVCRMNLAAWKAAELPGEWLFKMFAESVNTNVNRREAGRQDNGAEKFEEYISCAEAIIEKGDTVLSFDEWCEFLCEYRKGDITAVHHSPKYREQEFPAYRIVNSRCIKLLPVLEKAAGWYAKEEAAGSGEAEKRPCIIAIDGRAAAGKSTCARELCYILDGDIVEMDEFFLPLSMRTPERFKIPGGNVHYERFKEEVIPYVALPQNFSYRSFDCSIMDYNGVKNIKASPFRIVEGVYSCHPELGKYADITIFCDVSGQQQCARILERNGAGMLERFQNEWIPLEEEYFETYKIKEQADIYLA